MRYRILTTIDDNYTVEKLNTYYNGSVMWWQWSPKDFDTIKDAKKWIDNLDPKLEFTPKVVWDSEENDNKEQNYINHFFERLSSFGSIFTWTTKTTEK